MYSRTSSKKVSASHASLEVGWLAYRWRQVHLLGLASVRKKVKKGKDPSCDDGPDRAEVRAGPRRNLLFWATALGRVEGAKRAGS